MCLWIKFNQEENERDLKKWFNHHKKWFGSNKGYAYVYKTLHEDLEKGFYRSLWHDEFIWDFRIQKIFQVERDSKPTVDELHLRQIDRGLHVYTSIETTKKDFYYICRKNTRIAKFRVLKEDIVAVENGYIKDKHNAKEAICRKLTFVKVI
jgi:hypothetical protein